MVTFSGLCLDLFVLAQQETDSAVGASRGRVWEDAVAERLAGRGIPVESVPGGYRVLGFLSLSGLAHQVDSALACSDAIILAEWKAYRGTLPKNELLRFKAATDDYYMAFGAAGLSRPVLRVFGGIGEASHELRRYAALHGIALIERDRWPVPILASTEFIWPGNPADGPSGNEQHALAWGVRPLQRVLRPHQSGGFLLPRPQSAARVDSLLLLHEHWSDRLWDDIDFDLGGPERLLFQPQRQPNAA